MKKLIFSLLVSIAIAGIAQAQTVSVSSTNVLCNGECNGTATVYVQPPGNYRYWWPNGDTTQTTGNLCAGTHVCIVTDSLGVFVDSASVVIQEPAALLMTAITTDVSCFGGDDGDIQLSVTGGTPPYSYHWSCGTTWIFCPDASAGTYSVTITDVNGCTAAGSFTINQPPQISVSISVTNESVCGACDGSVIATITGGGPAPYTFQWSTGSATPNMTNLCSGVYSLTVVDANGCATVASGTITSISGINLSIINFAAADCNVADTIELSFSGGLAPYFIDWGDGNIQVANTSPVYYVYASPGVYTIFVSDSNGCSATITDTINELIIISLAQSRQPSCNMSDGMLKVAATGGTPPITFEWNTGDFGDSLANLPPGNYSVTATDANGCHRHKNFNLSNPLCLVTIAGNVYHDLNGNCVRDTAEPGLPNILIDINPGGGLYTDSNGNYSFYVPAGAYTISQTPAPMLNPICPVPASYTFLVTTDTLNNDFANEVIPIQDLAIAITCGPARPGFHQNVSFTVYNSGIPMSGYVELTLDSRTSYLNNYWGIAPDSVSGNKVYWNFSNLGTNQTFNSSNRIQASPPPTLNLGDVIIHSITVYPVTGDVTPSDNTTTCGTIVSNSWDPNDKAVSPADDGAEGNILQEDSLLYYTIRFQNTGNDTAFTVVIKDTLDSDLDHSSFRLGTTSHNCEVFFEQDNVVVFSFENIMLPDSNRNEPASNGHVTYYIKHNGVLPIGTEITNSAAIYFDYNLPVITNTVVSTIHLPVKVKEVFQDSWLAIYPNPAQDILMLHSELSLENVRVTISDLAGKIIKEELLDLSTIRPMDVSFLENGAYLLTAHKSQHDKTQIKFIKVDAK